MPNPIGRIVSLGLFGVIFFVGTGFAARVNGPTLEYAPYLPFSADSFCTGGGRSGYIDWYPTVSCAGYTVKGIGIVSPTTGSVGAVSDEIEYNVNGTGYCWCKMLSPAVSKWVSIAALGTLSTCAGFCSTYFVNNTYNLRGIMLSNIVSY